MPKIKFNITEIQKIGLSAYLKQYGKMLMTNCLQEQTNIAAEILSVFSQITSHYFEGGGIIKKYPQKHEILAQILNGAIPEDSTTVSEDLSMWLSAFDEEHDWHQKIWGEENMQLLLLDHLKDAFHELARSNIPTIR